jgi:hypothetical protein
LKEEQAREANAMAQKRRLARIQKGIDISMAVGQASIGIIKSFVDFKMPFSLIMASIIAATTGLQIARISAQKYEKGGSFILGGKRHSEGGEMIAPGREAESGEAVSVFSRNATKKHFPLIKSFENMINSDNVGNLNSGTIVNINNEKSEKYLGEIAENTKTKTYLNSKGKTVTIKQNIRRTSC